MLIGEVYFKSYFKIKFIYQSKYYLSYKRGKMKIFLDTANIQEIQKAFSLGVLDGVTTNPSLAAKENQNFDLLVKEILNVFKGTNGIINLEVISEKADDMARE